LDISSNILLRAFKDNRGGEWSRTPFTFRNLGWFLRDYLNPIFGFLKITPSYASKIQKYYAKDAAKLGDGIYLFHSFNVHNPEMKIDYLDTLSVLTKDEIHLQKNKPN